MVGASEFSRIVKLKQIGSVPLTIEANAEERHALARRFGIESIGSLRAQVELDAEGRNVSAAGHVVAAIEQRCAVTGEPFMHEIRETLDLLFVPTRTYAASDEDDPLEVDLDFDDADEIEYDGDRFDLGEAVAQTLALAIDPYAEGPDADTFRKDMGLSDDETPQGPLAAMLKDLSRP